MSELLQFPPSPDLRMKAFIIYDDFASAAQANTALHRSARNANSNAHFNASLWRIETLRFPPTAEGAWTDALDAHLVVIADRCAQSPPFWLQCWLEHWAKCRQVKEAAMALFGVRPTHGFADTAMSKFGSVASRYGLSLVWDDGRDRGDRSNKLDLWFADLPTAERPPGSVLSFTCFWKHEHRWQGHNWQVSVI